MKLWRDYKDSFSGLSREVWMLSFMMLINRIGTLILPFLTLYTTQELSWNESKGGIAASAFGLGGLAGAYVGGRLTDAIGFRKTMMISFFSSTFFFWVAQYFSEFYSFCLVLFLGSFFADAVRPALYGGLAFVTDKVTRTRAISLMRMAFNLGLAIGPAIAGVLITFVGYRSIFIIDSVTCLLAGVYLILFIKDYSDRKEEAVVGEVESALTARKPLGDIYFMAFAVSNLLMLIAFFQIIYTVPIYIKDYLSFTEKEVGIFFAVNGLFILIFEMPIMKYIEVQGLDRFRLMIIGALMMTGSLLFLELPSVYLIPLSLYTIFVSFGEIINFPFITTLTMDRSTPANRGAYMGITTMSFSLAIIVAPIIGTYILEHYGWSFLWLGMFTLGMIGIAGYGLVQNRFMLTMPADEDS